MNARNLLIGLFCQFLPLSLLAQDVLPYRVLSVNDGLVQQQVKALFKDSRGYLWIGTQGGVSRFNGETFENFTERDGLLAKRVVGFDEDSLGRIRIVTRKGVSIYDGHGFQSFPSPGKLYTFLHTDTRGRMVISQTDGPILCFDAGSYFPVTDVFPELKRLDADVLTDAAGGGRLVRDNNFRLWAVYGGATKLLGERTPDFMAFPCTIGGEPYALVQNQKGLPYYLSRLQKGALIRKHEFEPGERAANFLFDYRQEWFHYLDREKRIVYQQHVRTGARKALLSEFAEKQINAVWPDPASHTTWIGTDHGLFQVFTSGFRQLRDTTLTWPWAIQEDDDGHIWIANYHGGLIRYDGERFERAAIPSFAGTTHLDFYFGASRDRRGHLFFPTQAGLLERSPEGRFTFIEPLQDRNTFLMSRYDPFAEKLLLAGFRRLVIYDPLSGVCRNIPLEGGLHGSSFCVSVARDSFDHYWAGSFYGLTRHHLPSGRTHHYLLQEGTLPVDGIICLQSDHRGTLWMGTTSGLGKWDYAGDSLALVLPEVFRTNITSLTPVDTTWLAIGSVDGLYLLHLPSYYRSTRLRLRHYNHRNGFPGIEPEQNAGFVDSRGRLWIIASNGVFYIPREELSIDKEPSNLLFTSLNGEKLAFGQQDTVRVLPFGVNQLTVSFENVGPASSQRPEYSWKLEGFDPEFSPWTTGNTAIYNSLGPGRHTLVVRSRDPSAAGGDEHAGARLEIRLSMPFWRWPNFYKWAFLGLISLGGLSGGLILLNRKAHLDIEEREKLIRYYQAQTLQAQLNPHFLKNLLTTVQGFIRRERPDEAAEQVARLADMMQHFMESSIQGDLGLHDAHNEISLRQEITLLRYYVEFQQLQYPGLFTFELELDPAIDPDSELLPPLLIQPFLENAIEHGLRQRAQPGGHLWLRFARAGSGLRCTVEDNGIGRAAAAALQARSPRLFRPRGAQLVFERVRLLRELGHRIGVDIADRPGGGTVVRIGMDMV